MEAIVHVFKATYFRNFRPSNNLFSVTSFRMTNDRLVNRIVPFLITRRVGTKEIRRNRDFVVITLVGVDENGRYVGAIYIEDVQVNIRVITWLHSNVAIFRFVHQACRRMFDLFFRIRIHFLTSGYTRKERYNYVILLRRRLFPFFVRVCKEHCFLTNLYLRNSERAAYRNACRS